MIAAGIFLCLFILLVLTLRRHAWFTVIFFFISLTALVLLFVHHATDALNLNF